MGIPYAEVIGDPVAHSKSPLIHEFWLEKTGVEGDYRACRVTAGGLADYFSDRSEDPDWRGCSITMPHKYAAIDHVHVDSDPSFPVEPINMAFRQEGSGRIDGFNSDKAGFMEPLLPEHGGQVARPRGPAVIVGAGGAAAAAAWMMPVMGYAPVWIVARDPAKAARMAAQFEGVGAVAAPYGDPLPEARLLVNASPLGMAGYPPFPFSIDGLAEDGIVYDMVYAPPETALIREARRRGLLAIDGLAMLVGQAAIAFHAFFRVPAPRAFDDELRERLTG
ncbi:MAG TPA: shikimate dehydrogenase [Allosphingosinicella sp.]|jgi:shikimate dehydrogenase|nr:shikimate dehydrogenase [Allosphingosinicella sp.]